MFFSPSIGTSSSTGKLCSLVSAYFFRRSRARITGRWRRLSSRKSRARRTCGTILR